MLRQISLALLLISQVVISTDNMDSKTLSSAIVQFSAKFCNELVKDKNVVSSPLSAEFVLALVSLGASGSTHDELLTALGLPDDDAIRSSFSQISSKIRDVKGVTLNVANKVYIKEGRYELLPELKKDAIQVFDAELEKVDFANSAAAAKLINGWVESKTNNKIKDLLSEDSFNEDTRLVLINALYFKGNWKKQFNPNNTSDQPFFIKKDVTVNVPMMYKEDNYKFGYSEFLQAKLLEMPYVGDEASMVIVLPDEIEGLDDVLKKLADGHNLLDDFEKMYSEKVQVTIPKFKIETEIDLTQLLPKLGIQTIFDQQRCTLNKLLDSCEPLYVSKAVQKAFIEVNEEGAEAAAATGMVMMMRCARPRSLPFRADRPFLYVLAGPASTPYFIGAYRAKS